MEIETKKIKDLKKKGNKKPRTQKQIEASRVSGTLFMLTKNPVKNPEVVEKIKRKLKGRILTPESLFKPGNQFGRLRKNRKISDEQKIKLSIKKIGRPLKHLKKYQFTSEQVKKNNPMKDPEKARKQHLNDKRNFKISAEKIIEELSNGKSMYKIAKEYEVHRSTLYKILKRKKEVENEKDNIPVIINANICCTN